MYDWRSLSGESHSAAKEVTVKSLLLLVALISPSVLAQGADSWPQLQGDALRSGNAPAAVLPEKLGLLGTAFR